jgi:hypothetical protein
MTEPATPSGFDNWIFGFTLKVTSLMQAQKAGE